MVRWRNHSLDLGFPRMGRHRGRALGLCDIITLRLSGFCTWFVISSKPLKPLWFSSSWTKIKNKNVWARRSGRLQVLHVERVFESKKPKNEPQPALPQFYFNFRWIPEGKMNGNQRDLVEKIWWEVFRQHREGWNVSENVEMRENWSIWACTLLSYLIDNTEPFIDSHDKQFYCIFRFARLFPSISFPSWKVCCVYPFNNSTAGPNEL